MGRLREKLSDDSDDSGIDISPLLDCVFILLIFFIVTTVFVEETGVEVQKPTAASAKDLEKRSLLIALTREGRIVYGGREYSLHGLRAIVTREVANEDVPVVILADRDAGSGMLVDVIDECKLAGAKNVSLAAKREGAP